MNGENMVRMSGMKNHEGTTLTGSIISAGADRNQNAR
jgi:hypothetical protein